MQYKTFYLGFKIFVKHIIYQYAKIMRKKTRSIKSFKKSFLYSVGQYKTVEKGIETILSILFIYWDPKTYG